MISTNDKAIFFLFQRNCNYCKKYDDEDILCQHYVEKHEADINNYFFKDLFKKDANVLFQINA